MTATEDAGLDIDFDLEPAPQGIITPKADRELAQVQGITSGVVEGSVVADPAATVEFMGKDFRISDKVGLMPLLKFSAAVDFDISDPRALSAMYAMLKDCIYEGTPACGQCTACKDDRESACPSFDAGDWKAFEDHATATKADADELMDVLTKVMEIITGRPTKPPATSSRGRRGTSGGSTGSSSARRAGGRRR
jgi:hypothetical protein